MPELKNSGLKLYLIFVVARGGGGEQGQGEKMDWEVGVSRCKLLYVEWINNMVLVYSTGNYIHYPIINHNRNEDEKEYTCVYISEPLGWTAGTNTF